MGANKYRYVRLGFMGWWEFTPVEAQAFADEFGVELIGGFVATIVRPRRKS